MPRSGTLVGQSNRIVMQSTIGGAFLGKGLDDVVPEVREKSGRGSFSLRDHRKVTGVIRS
jgi:hypothetical protein